MDLITNIKIKTELLDNQLSNVSEISSLDLQHKPITKRDLTDNNREFHVLDEIRCEDSNDENEEGNYAGDNNLGKHGDSNGYEAMEDDDEDDDDDEEQVENDIDYEEIESMLDEGLPDNLRNKIKEQQFQEKLKTVLDEKGVNHFEILPEGWIQTTHASGMHIYLHKASRVCTTTKPYFLGQGSVRKHAIPLSAIPCLNYQRALDKEQELRVAATKTSNENSQNMNIDKLLLPNATIETVSENLESQSLSAEQLAEYCRKLFRFKTVRVMRFKSWSARRKFTKNRKNIKHLQRPTLPDGTKLITFPILSNEAGGSGSETRDSNTDNTNLLNGSVNIISSNLNGTENTNIQRNNFTGRQRKEWIMNPNGKSCVCILHEYVQHALKKQPSYEFRELENAATPYSATVTINNLKYGTGYGTSKKLAKSEAARETLEILIPQMRDKITNVQNKTTMDLNGVKRENDDSEVVPSTSEGIGITASNSTEHQTTSIFDEIDIEDPRITEFCSKTTEPTPYSILVICLKRNFGLGDVKIEYHMNTNKHRQNAYTMQVGKHVAKVICKNKRDGKQKAAQAILKILHPHIKTWGSLLRMYGTNSVKSFKEKKQEEQEITVLQSKAAINQPNYAILDKLKLEMTKLRESRLAIKPIGTFIPPPDINLPSASCSNLKNVDL